MKPGAAIAVAVLVLAAASAFGVVSWLRRLQGVAAEKAQARCELPEDRSCAADKDCVEVLCQGQCLCGEDCGVAVSVAAMRAEHHPCLLPKLEHRVPVACRPAQPCDCVRERCRTRPVCVAGLCQMAPYPNLLPDGGDPP